MIDSQLLQVGDIFIFEVLPRDGGQVITGNVLRGRKRLLRSPHIVQIHDRWPEVDRADEHLVDSMIRALPMIPEQFLLEGIVANGPDGLPLPVVGDKINGDPIARLTAKQRVYCQLPAPNVWSGVEEVQFRVIDKEAARRRRRRPGLRAPDAVLHLNPDSRADEPPIEDGPATTAGPDPDGIPTEIDQSRGLLPIRPVAMDLQPVPSIFGKRGEP